MLTTTVIRADGVVEHDGLVLGDLGTEGSLVWVDSTGPDEGDLALLAEAFPLHELAVEDVSRHGQRAKLEIYPDHAFLVAYARAADGDLSEVDLFVGPGWLVSVRETNELGEVFELDVVKERYRRVRDLDRGAGFLLYVLLDALVDGYFDAIEESEDELERVEEILFDLGPPPEGALQRDLLELRKALVMFRRRVVPLRDVVLSILRREVEWIEEEAIIYFQDVLDHLLRVIDQIDTQRELMGNVVDASLALSGNRMNQVMKKMTSWGAILIVATLIAGIYGMNFKNMPELGWHYGYFFALGSMLVVTGGLYLYFKRKSWL
jgi:magnesium transporter